MVLIPFSELINYLDLGKLHTEAGRAELHAQLIERIKRGRNILISLNTDLYVNAGQYLDEAATLIVSYMFFEYSPKQKAEFVNQYKSELPNQLSKCTNDDAIIEIAARTIANTARALSRLHGRNGEATAYFRRASMLLRNVTEMNSDQKALSDRHYALSFETGYSGEETIGKNKLIELYSDMATDPEYKGTMISEALQFIKSHVYTEVEKSDFRKLIANTDLSSIEDITANMVLCLILGFNGEHCYITESHQLADKMNQATSSQRSTVGSINLFIFHQIKIIGLYRADTKAGPKYIDQYSAVLYQQASTLSFLSSYMFDLADHTLMMLDPPALTVMAIPPMTAKPLPDTDGIAVNTLSEPDFTKDNAAIFLAKMRDPAFAQCVGDLNERSFREIRDEYAQKYVHQYENLMIHLNNEDAKLSDIEDFFLEIIHKVRDTLVSKDTFWYETVEKVLAKALDLFARTNLVSVKSSIVARYIKQENHKKFIASANHASASYELLARCVANHADLHMRINTVTDNHDAISLYRRAAIVMRLAPNINEAQITQADIWSTKANNLTINIALQSLNKSTLW